MAPLPDGAGERDGGDRPRAEVQVTWRLFETQHWLDGKGTHESAIVELLIDGGTPARVQLGRRDSSECAVRAAVEGQPALARLECAHARAEIVRASGSELRVEAVNLDLTHAGPPNGANATTVTVRIPDGADIVVSSELTRMPDEATGIP